MIINTNHLFLELFSVGPAMNLRYCKDGMWCLLGDREMIQRSESKKVGGEGNENLFRV